MCFQQRTDFSGTSGHLVIDTAREVFGDFLRHHGNVGAFSQDALSIVGDNLPMNNF